MKVKIFDKGHELDLEEVINTFIKDREEEITIEDIKFSSSHFYSEEEQRDVYSFSAMIIYNDWKK